MTKHSPNQANFSSSQHTSTLLAEVKECITANEPVPAELGVALLHHDDLLGIGQLAHSVRERLHGNLCYYNWNLHLNSTNVCEADCLFCSFARLEEGMPSAYTMTIQQAENWIRERYKPGMTEIHIVNGLNPNLPFTYYTQLLQMVKQNFPELHIKGFTAVEIHYFAEKFGMSYTEVIQALVDAGLGSMPGGGAEIFAPRFRKKICRDKVSGQGWLDVHKTAHSLGLKSNCTMLYGCIETPEEVIDHMVQLRNLQSETGGFQTFIPLAYHSEGNRMAQLGSPTGFDDLRMIAVSRLMLHNIPHIKAYWVMLGVKTAQVALRFGANDLDGTVTEEKIYHMAGSRSPDELSISSIKRLIERAGCEPVERTTTYERIVRHAPIETESCENRIV
jgi:aminodeoxyfutalosine synthase